MISEDLCYNGKKKERKNLRMLLIAQGRKRFSWGQSEASKYDGMIEKQCVLFQKMTLIQLL